MKTLKIFTLIALSGFGLIRAQQTPADTQSEAISIVGATAHIGDGTVVENATLVFENGKITALAAGAATQGKVINAQGKHVYPGFIAGSTSLGLVEIDAVRPTRDMDELGDMIPHIRSMIAYNAESKVVESMRPNGVLLAQVSPKGGRISGTSSVMQLDAWNWEDAVVKADDGIHLNWPATYRSGRWWMGEEPGFHPNKKYGEQVDETLQFLANAKAYNQKPATEANIAFAGAKGLFDGTQKLYIYANGEKEIIDAISRLHGAGVQKMVLVGGYEAHKTADLLKQHQVPVMVNATHNLPFYNDDDYDHAYKLPALLVKAGLLVGIQNMDAANFQVRNLPFYAGHAAGYGLDKETALQLISSNTAKILGIDAQYGSLKVGKSATLFISEGDALDMRGNQLTHAFIDGREISLETHQTKLYKRYSNKYKTK